MIGTTHRSAPGQGGEYTACGMAFDAHDSGDEDEPIVFAEPGKVYDCAECRRVVDAYRATRGYRQPPEGVE